MKSILRYLIFGLVLTNLCSTGVAQTPAILEENVSFSASIEGRAYLLQAVIYRPNDDARHPLVVLSHGRPGISDRLGDPGFTTRTAPLGRALASEGIAVAFFLRRGYSQSEGPNGDLGNTAVESGLQVAKEFRAAVDYWQEQSFVIRDKVVVIGYSHGGWGAMASASVMMDSGVLGIVNISGGSAYLQQEPEGVLSTVVQDHWVAGAAELGKDALLPTLWLYSENDTGIPGPVARRMFEAYNGAGGMGTLLMLPSYNNDGHFVLLEPNLFIPQLNDYFATIGLRDEATEAPSIVEITGGGARSSGSDVVLNMSITANPLPTIQWRKNGMNLQNIPNKIAGVTSSALSIFDVQSADAGAYTFVLTNSLGSVTSSAIPVSLGSTSTPTSSPTSTSSSGGGGGGGGAPSSWFIVALVLLATTRWIIKRSQATIDSIDFRSHWVDS